MRNGIQISGFQSWMESMREAACDAVGPGDVQEIAQAMLKKAKNGDVRAAEFLFKLFMSQQVTRVHQHHTVEQVERREVLDLGPRPNDPSPSQIAEACGRIKQEHIEAMSNGAGRKSGGR